MKLSKDTKERMDSALQLLSGIDISLSTFENVRGLIKGIHPELDKKLATCSKALDVLQKLQSGDIVTLSAQHLPEKDEKQKKRKKALLFFIQSIKDLKSEIKRVQSELQSYQNSSQNQLMQWGKIIKFAKGPFGLVTLAAIIIVIGMTFFGNKTTSKQVALVVTPTPKNTVQVITYQNKQIPLSQLRIGPVHIPGCDGQHYHALSSTETVTALDGTVFYDPGGCGFGKVSDMKVTTISK